jgi:prevent-host-death family protein
MLLHIVMYMITVGIRELRNRLSLYLKQVAEGQQIKVTNRGEVIALLIPAKGGKKIDKELIALVEEGLASWAGGKPQGASRPVKGRGRPLSEIIIEDRR